VSVREILDNTRTVALRKKLIAHENVVKYFQEHPYACKKIKNNAASN